MQTQFNWTIPSDNNNILENIIGKEIRSIIKASHETYSDHISYLNDVGIAGYRDQFSFFKYALGSFIFSFSDGTECAFSSAEDLNSIIMSLQKSSTQEINQNYIFDDDDVLDFIKLDTIESSTDLQNTINKKITTINILTKANLNDKEKLLPSEKGVEFIFENHKKIILSHNLTENNFVFSIQTETDALERKDFIVLKTYTE